MPRFSIVRAIHWTAAAVCLLGAILGARDGDPVRAGGMAALAGSFLILASETETRGITRRRAAAYVLMLVALALVFSDVLLGR